MAAKTDYEVHTQQKFTIIATKANLDHDTPEVGHACLIGGNQVGVVVADREGDDKVTVDVGRSVYMQQVDSPVDASGEIAEGQNIYYEVGTTAEPFLTTIATANVLAGVAVLAHDDDVFPKGATGTATVENVAVLFNA